MTYFLRVCSLYFLFFSLLISCARPNYQDNPPSPDNSNYQGSPPSLDDSQNPSVEDSSKTIHTEKPKACSYVLKNESLCVSLKWIQFPTQKEYGSFVLSFENLQQNSVPIEGVLTSLFKRLSIVLWMPSMGHGSVPVTISAKNATSLSVTHVFFIMPGEWEIRVQIREGAQEKDEKDEQVIFRLSI